MSLREFDLDFDANFSQPVDDSQRQPFLDVIHEIQLKNRDIFRKAMDLYNRIDASSSMKKYAKKTKLSVKELQSSLHLELNRLIDFVEKVDTEHYDFIKLPRFTNDQMDVASHIPVFQEIWFGDYFDVVGYDALVALQYHLHSILDQLSLKYLVKSLGKH